MVLNNFLKQIPLPIILMLIVLAAISIFLMVNIIQRSRKRRELEREPTRGTSGSNIPISHQMTGPKSQRNALDRLGVGDFMRGQLPEKPLESAAWSVPLELRDLPEPDLDMLSVPAAINDLQPVTQSAPPAPTSAPQPVEAYAEPARIAPAAEQDWLSAISPDTPVEEANPEMSASAGQNTDSSSSNSAITAGDGVEVMRVYRDLSDGKLIIQLGDGTYRTFTDIKNPDLARRFSALVRELWAMINGGAEAPVGTDPALSTGTYPAADSSTQATDGNMKKRIGLLNSQPEPAKRQNQGLLKGFGRNQSAPKEETPMGIAGAVEDFLQYKLSNTPQFATRTIHIRPTHDSGLRIEVDGHSYDSIGDIIDADVRDFLFNMMREWEARH